MSDYADAICGIGQLHAHFVDAVFRQDFAEFADCFAKDGVWKIAGMTLDGREAIHAAATGLLSRCEKIQLIAQPPILSVHGHTAQGRQQMVELAKMPDGQGFLTIGVYHDTYVMEDGRWRFARRHWSMKYRGPTPLDGAFVDTPDYGPFPASPAHDEETYVRPAT